MSEKPKMADVFKLPLARTQHLSEAIPNFGIDDGNEEELVPFQLEEPQAEAIVRAVNEYDPARAILQRLSTMSLDGLKGPKDTMRTIVRLQNRVRKLLGAE